MGSELRFYAFAAVAVIASALVIGQRNPIYSVMLLIASFLGLAGLYVLLEAPFLAVIQIVIYPPKYSTPAAVAIRFSTLAGSSTFHPNFMSWS